MFLTLDSIEGIEIVIGLGDCDYPLLAGDGFCDDEANTHLCDFDDGDCCEFSAQFVNGTSSQFVNTLNCLHCMCFGM